MADFVERKLLNSEGKSSQSKRNLLCYKQPRITEPPWRNWLARSAVNRKVGGSSPPGGADFFLSLGLAARYVHIFEAVLLSILLSILRAKLIPLHCVIPALI